MRVICDGNGHQRLDRRTHQRTVLQTYDNPLGQDRRAKPSVSYARVGVPGYADKAPALTSGIGVTAHPFGCDCRQYRLDNFYTPPPGPSHYARVTEPAAYCKRCLTNPGSCPD